MHDLRSRVAYLQGLSSGIDLDENTKEGKLLVGIINVLEDFANYVDELEEAQEQIEDYLESIDEDLYQLEDTVYDGEYVDGGDDYLEVECPNCGETVCFEASILEDDETVEVACPNCDEVVFVNDDDFQTGDEPEQLEFKAGTDE